MSDTKTPVRPADIRLIIWDLDDTFWGGTLTENEGGEADPSAVHVRENCVKLARLALDLGIMNSVCSRNDFEPAMEALSQTAYGDLRPLFVFPSINWEAKGARVKQIIEDMGLRPVNVLFLDDSAFNLREAKFVCPDLMTGTPEIADEILAKCEDALMRDGVSYETLRACEEKAEGDIPAQMTPVVNLPERIFFPDGSEIVTDPAHSRLAHYRMLETKREEKKQAVSNEQFLIDSDIRVTIDTHCNQYLDRITELVARTNQLNYTKQRDDREALEALVEADDYSCAVVKAYDKFGDYGIVGFYAVDLAEDVLVHFLFSCRTLGMGVEQYVYQKLKFPMLDVKGEVASPLVKENKVTWIADGNAEPDSASSKGESTLSNNRNETGDMVSSSSRSAHDIFIKGPCDMDQMIPFLQQELDTPLYMETNYVDERGVIISGNNNLIHLKEAKEYTAEDIIKNIEAAPFLTLDSFETDMFSETHGIVFFSLLAETHAGVYRNRETGFRICFGSSNFDLTAPENAEKYITGEYPNHNFSFTQEIIERFRKAYIFEGSLSAGEIVAHVSWLREALPQTTKLVLLAGSEIEAKPNTEEFAGFAEKYREVNCLLRERLKGTADVLILEMKDFITGQDCFAGCTNHFSRQVYRNIAARFASLIGCRRGKDALAPEKEIAFVRGEKSMITPYAEGVTIIVTVHNEFENAVKCIESIRMCAGADDVDLVVADNHSVDGFREWAKIQTDFTYVYFEEGTLPYGSILNQILTGLDIRSNVFIVSCRYMLTEGALFELRKTLYAGKHTGSVGCMSNGALSPLQQMEPEQFEQTDNATDFRVYGWMDDAVCFKTETINRVGLFDEKLFTVADVMKDYSLRMIEKRIGAVVCRRAYLYAFRDLIDEPEDILIRQIDDNRRMEETWGIHYISVIGNLDVVSLMEEDGERALQVLEIGCDVGATLFYIREKYPKAVIHGCDINDAPVKIAKYSMDAFVNNIEEENLPFEKESLDVVIFADVLEHLHNPLKAIRYIRTLLRNGGCILASIPNLMHISVMRGLLQGNFTYTETGLLDKTHIHLFTYNEILRMFRDADYRVEHVETRGIGISEDDRALIQRLCALDQAAQPFMYETFQYLVRVRK